MEDQPAERPWTPSYSVHSQGSPRTEDLPDQRPWTPSYSVHSQGSPLLTPTHVAEDDVTSVEKMDVQEKEVVVPEVDSEVMPKNEEFISTAESVAGQPLKLEADAAEFVTEEYSSHSVVRPVAHDVSQPEEIVQAPVTQESVVAPVQIEEQPLELEADAAEFVADYSSLSVVQPVADAVSHPEEIAQGLMTQESIPGLVLNVDEEVTQVRVNISIWKFTSIYVINFPSSPAVSQLKSIQNLKKAQYRA